jgi:hypothetical protein
MPSFLPVILNSKQRFEIAVLISGGDKKPGAKATWFIKTKLNQFFTL